MLRSRAANERTVEKETQRSPGVPIKLIVASTITNPGLEQHPNDDILDEDQHQQEGVIAAATGHRVHVQSGARTKTSNTYFHRVAQHGQAVDRQTKTVVRPIHQNQTKFLINKPSLPLTRQLHSKALMHVHTIILLLGT